MFKNWDITRPLVDIPLKIANDDCIRTANLGYRKRPNDRSTNCATVTATVKKCSGL